MIAYKVFNLKEGGLYPVFMRELIACDFEHYPRGYTHTRANNCGPFACFTNLKSAERFASGMAGRNFVCETAIHKVEILQSAEESLWVDNLKVGVLSLPENTILADEFEILEEVSQ